MLSRQVSRLAWKAYNFRRVRSSGELVDFECLNPGCQRRSLAEKLHAQVQYFGSRPDALPEWKAAARIREPQDLWSVWDQLPIVSKDLLRSRFDPNEMRARFRLEGRIDATGGSTGEPTRFFHDRAMIEATRAARLYTELRMGWKPGMATVIVWGSERDIGKNTAILKRAGLKLLQQYVVDGYGIDDRTVERVLALIQRKAPVALYGFSSLLEVVAERAIDMGKRAKIGDVATAWNGGEMLLPRQGAVFREAFGVALLNRYGGRELSAMACQYQDRGPLNVLRPWLFVEVVDRAGKAVAPGETGRLLWTSTVCRGTPFLRYDIGDLGNFAPDDTDESGVRRLRGLEGRTAGTIDLSDGRKMSCLYWNHLFKGYPEVRQFQVVVSRNTQITLLLQGNGFAPEREVEIREAIRCLLGDRAITLKWVDSIPRTPQGKLSQVVEG